MATIPQARPATTGASARSRRRLSAILVNGALAIICLLWTLPTLGLLISSFRTRADITSTGWWTVVPHRDFLPVEQIDLGRGFPVDGPITLDQVGATVTDEQLRAGVVLPDGRRLEWANRRQRIIDVQQQSWTSNANFTLDNYQSVLIGREYTYKQPDGTLVTDQGQNLSQAFISTLAVSIPATLIPILIAAFAAHAFAWMRFPGRRLMFAMVVALLVVPLQVAMIPILRDYTRLDLIGSYLAVWLAHTGFGLPLATYLLYNYISQLPRETLEAAFIDGASPFTIFTRMTLPLSVPALASFAIFQFLWVWNDYLVALIFLQAGPQSQVITQRLAAIVGTRGQDWHLLTAGAFVSMLLPLIVFFSLQRYFVRGLLAGSVKG
ncbi:MAG: carbohydrate ABC transporter permease [Roseiflexaceae bacterium]|nr:carbohydrate ABC transporter permease [Roseiflexaceae bacterium]